VGAVGLAAGRVPARQASAVLQQNDLRVTLVSSGPTRTLMFWVPSRTAHRW
jgi:hypothetical protein